MTKPFRILFLGLGCLLLGIQFGPLVGGGIFFLSVGQIAW